MRRDTPYLIGPSLPPDYTPEEFEIYQELGGGSFWAEDTSKIYIPLIGKPDLQFIISYCFENRHRLGQAAKALGTTPYHITMKQKEALDLLKKHDYIKKLLIRH